MYGSLLGCVGEGSGVQERTGIISAPICIPPADYCTVQRLPRGTCACTCVTATHGTPKRPSRETRWVLLISWLGSQQTGLAMIHRL